jgi:sulfate transport system ATP-binding protein
MGIEIRELVRNFGKYSALKGVNLSIDTGELVALLGPSGCGKTTLLRIIAGIDSADRGRVFVDGKDMSRLSVQDRRIGFVFQHYALFRHMTVYENVAFGLQAKPRKLRPSRAGIGEKVESLLKLVQLEWAGARLPDQLSGGQRQRVALARALAVEPKIMLLDEPFGALDTRVRRELRRRLRRMHDELKITSIFVTHDQEEALELADRIIVMNEGRIEQIGAPEELYDKPANSFVYKFLGSVNLFHGRVDSGVAKIGDVEFQSEHYAELLDTDKAFTAYIRPHEIKIDRSRRSELAIEAAVRHIRATGPLVSLELDRLDNRQPVYAEMDRERYLNLGLKKGERVFLEIDNLRVFTDDREEPEYYI